MCALPFDWFRYSCDRAGAHASHSKSSFAHRHTAKLEITWRHIKTLNNKSATIAFVRQIPIKSFSLAFAVKIPKLNSNASGTLDDSSFRLLWIIITELKLKWMNAVSECAHRTPHDSWLKYKRRPQWFTYRMEWNVHGEQEWEMNRFAFVGGTWNDFILFCCLFVTRQRNVY